MSDLLGYLYGVIAVGICMIPGGILVYLLDKKGYQEDQRMDEIHLEFLIDYASELSRGK